MKGKGKSKGTGKKGARGAAPKEKAAPKVEPTADYKLKLLTRDEYNPDEKARRAEERRIEAEKRKKALEEGKGIESYKDHDLSRLGWGERYTLQQIQAEREGKGKGRRGGWATSSRIGAPLSRGGAKGALPAVRQRERPLPTSNLIAPTTLSWGASSSKASAPVQRAAPRSGMRPIPSSASTAPPPEAKEEKKETIDWHKSDWDWNTNGWGSDWGKNDWNSKESEKENDNQKEEEKIDWSFAIGERVRVPDGKVLSYSPEDYVAMGDMGTVDERMIDSQGSFKCVFMRLCMCMCVRLRKIQDVGALEQKKKIVYKAQKQKKINTNDIRH